MAEPNTVDSAGKQSLIAEALQSTRMVLALLDQAGAPADIGAHIDRAIVRLEETINGAAAR